VLQLAVELTVLGPLVERHTDWWEAEKWAGEAFLAEAKNSNLKLTIDYVLENPDQGESWGEEHGSLTANCQVKSLENKFPRH
jgi:hypothetical protein